MRRSSLWKTLAVSLVVVALVVPVVATRKGVAATEVFGSVPTLCPISVPIPGSTWRGTTYPVPIDYNNPLSSKIPFRIDYQELTTRVQPVMVGQGWYKPSPLVNYVDAHWWAWVPPHAASDPGVLWFCHRYRMGAGAFWIDNLILWWGGQTWGYATMLDPDNGSGSGGGQDECYELVEWWIDGDGRYHENVLASWCEDTNGDGRMS